MDIQLQRKILRSYPVVLSMLQCRGYDTRVYDRGAVIDATDAGGDEGVLKQVTDPMVVSRTPTMDGVDSASYHMDHHVGSEVVDAGESGTGSVARKNVSLNASPLFHFCGNDQAWEKAFSGDAGREVLNEDGTSRELRIIAEWNCGGALLKCRGLQKMRQMYSALMQFLEKTRARLDGIQASTEEADTLIELRRKVILLYRRASIPIAEVHYCCFPQKKQPTKNDIERGCIDAMQKTLHTDIMATHVATFKKISDTFGDDLAQKMEKEASHAYQQARRVILISYGKNERLLNRRSERDNCAREDEERASDTVIENLRLQIFNIDNLLFDVRKHVYVPRHDVIDVWQQDALVQRMKDHYHIGRLITSLPIIYTNDAVAKFIGLSKHNLCQITRVNESAGTYTVYRYCL